MFAMDMLSFLLYEFMVLLTRLHVSGRALVAVHALVKFLTATAAPTHHTTTTSISSQPDTSERLDLHCQSLLVKERLQRNSKSVRVCSALHRNRSLAFLPDVLDL